MLEMARQQRNGTRLHECHPVFRAQLKRVLHDLEADAYRPRIQDAYRSLDAQRAAATSGASLLRWGYHNATTPDGQPDALAADVLDDDAPLAPSRRYLLRLAIAADRYGLSTGIDWGLPRALRRPIWDAIARRDADAVIAHLGWDACHVEVRGVTVAQARRGDRPTGGSYA